MTLMLPFISKMHDYRKQHTLQIHTFFLSDSKYIHVLLQSIILFRSPIMQKNSKNKMNLVCIVSSMQHTLVTAAMTTSFPHQHHVPLLPHHFRNRLNHQRLIIQAKLKNDVANPLVSQIHLPWWNIFDKVSSGNQYTSQTSTQSLSTKFVTNSIVFINALQEFINRVKGKLEREKKWHS